MSELRFSTRALLGIVFVGGLLYYPPFVFEATNQLKANVGDREKVQKAKIQGTRVG